MAGSYAGQSRSSNQPYLTRQANGLEYIRLDNQSSCGVGVNAHAITADLKTRADAETSGELGLQQCFKRAAVFQG